MHIVSKREREQYKLDLEMIQQDSQEMMTAQFEAGSEQRYMIKRTNGTFTFGSRMSCDTQLRRDLRIEPFLTIIPGHRGLPVNCCAHVLRQDPVKPEGFKLLPYGLFLCKTCFGLMERCRFKYAHIVMNCRDCVEYRAIKLREINPELFDDLRELKS